MNLGKPHEDGGIRHAALAVIERRVLLSESIVYSIVICNRLPIPLWILSRIRFSDDEHPEASPSSPASKPELGPLRIDGTTPFAPDPSVEWRVHPGPNPDAPQSFAVVDIYAHRAYDAFAGLGVLDESESEDARRIPRVYSSRHLIADLPAVEDTSSGEREWQARLQPRLK